MVFWVGSTGHDPLRSNERSLHAVSALGEAKAQHFMKKKKLVRFCWNYWCCNSILCVKNSGLRAKAEEGEKAEEKQGHGCIASSGHSCNCELIQIAGIADWHSHLSS